MPPPWVRRISLAVGPGPRESTVDDLVIIADPPVDGDVLPTAPLPPNVPRPQRFSLPLLAKRRESPSVMTFDFSTAGVPFEYRPNQAIRLSLPGIEDPWGAVRTFSLSSSPTETDRISVTCKITDTPFKQALARWEVGAAAEVVGPLGAFFFDGTRPSVFIAGG